MKNVLLSSRDAVEDVNSAVSEVTVFADRALVTRTMDAALEKGENRVAFASLGVGIVEESIKVKLSSGSATLSAAELETETLWYYGAEEHRSVWERARDTVAKLAEALDRRAVTGMENLILAELREYLRQNLSSILLEQEVSVAKLKDALAFLEEAQTANAETLISGRAEFAALERLLESLKAQLRRIQAMDSKQRNSIVLTIFAPKEEKVSITLSYILPNASWKPVYDSCLDAATGRVTIRVYGSVRQSTGETWEGAALRLSTAAVELSPEIPPIHPLYLSAQYQKRDKSVVVAEKEIQSLDDSLAQTTGAEPEEPAGGGGKGGSPEGAEASAVTKNAVSATFAVQGTPRVPSDGQWHRLPVIEKEFPSAAVYECVPELEEFVYVKASFVNDSGLPFLAGENQVYRNGSYMGRSRLDYAAVGETLNLSFGVDDDLRVRRIPLLREYRPAQGLIGKNALEVKVKYLLANYRGAAERVLVKEAVYLSELKEVEVRIMDDSSPGWKRDEEGIVSWEVELLSDPSKQVERVLHYRVEAGKSFDLASVCG